MTGGLNGGGPGQTLVADAGVTTPGRLTLQTRHTDWENGNNDGFFLFKTVPGDFQAEVQLTRFDIQAYHCTGLMVRAPDPAQAAAGEDYLAWFRFDQYGIANYLRNTTAGSSENVWPANNPNTNYWLRCKLAGTVSNRSAIGARVASACHDPGQDLLATPRGRCCR